MSASPAARLRALIDAPGLRVMPCCFDALRALGNSEQPEHVLSFERLRGIVGFEDYDAEAERYRVEEEGDR